MSQPACIFAFTEPGSEFPAYLSINVKDGLLEFTVRSPKKPPSGERPWVDAGDTAAMTLPVEEERKLYRAILGHLLKYAVAIPIPDPSARIQESSSRQRDANPR